jgi:hypothetical protein
MGKLYYISKYYGKFDFQIPQVYKMSMNEYSKNENNLPFEIFGFRGWKWMNESSNSYFIHEGIV